MIVFYRENVLQFESTLYKRWEEAHAKNVINYNLNLMYKLLPGKYLLTAQLNIERGQMRRRPSHFRSVDDDFDPRRFNYAKIRRKEVIAPFAPNAIQILLDFRCTDKPYTTDPLDRHFIIVNASPIERGHSLGLCCVNRYESQSFGANHRPDFTSLSHRNTDHHDTFLD